MKFWPLVQAEHWEGGGHSPPQADHFDQGLNPPGDDSDHKGDDVDDHDHDHDYYDHDSSQADQVDQVWSHHLRSYSIFHKFSRYQTSTVFLLTLQKLGFSYSPVCV